ncbi:MAG: hypothetical protein ACJLS2_08560 [Microcella pacifica]
MMAIAKTSSGTARMMLRIWRVTMTTPRGETFEAARNPIGNEKIAPMTVPIHAICNDSNMSRIASVQYWLYGSLNGFCTTPCTTSPP